ncbi:unnamed protein product [Prunus armeniaca]|uniref:Proline-rich protein 3-like n=1 Tax=Prunus armeniaca TaxID=36596 RepID=A0A6J5Y8K6_PRUAR|nr:unnamed protein product [Prunus armeniaca]
MAFNRFFSATSLLVLALVAVLITPSSAASNIHHDEMNLQSTKSILGIQGLVYCKSGPKVIPLEGSVARITCEAADEYGLESAPMTILSDATDAKGYFFATLSPYEIENHKKLNQCRAFLELSPLESCNVPTDLNNGISGAVLASYRLLHDKNIRLYTVGPFTFTSS